MAMVAIAYKTKPNTTDHAMSQTLVASFTGQLKGWWDHYQDKIDRNNILYTHRRNDDGIIVKDEMGVEIQDAVPTFIFVVAKHFIGDPTNLKDRSYEILANLRCKKLQNFKQYKDMFLTKVMTRNDSHQSFQKEKFIASLPNVFAKKVRTKPREQNNNKILYDNLTYRDLINVINSEGLQLCNYLRMKQQSKKE